MMESPRSRAADRGRSLIPMDTITATIQEWRNLGFHYDRDDDRRTWKITGSVSGLSRFSDILRRFASDPRNDVLFEHEHYGPYGYLKIINVPGEQGFNSNAIYAPRCEFAKLADLIDLRLANARPGASFDLSSDFAPDSEFELRLTVAPVDFDPGLFDPWVQQKISEQRDATKPPSVAESNGQITPAAG